MSHPLTRQKARAAISLANWELVHVDTITPNGERRPDALRLVGTRIDREPGALVSRGRVSAPVIRQEGNVVHTQDGREYHVYGAPGLDAEGHDHWNLILELSTEHGGVAEWHPVTQEHPKLIHAAKRAGSPDGTG